MPMAAGSSRTAPASRQSSPANGGGPPLGRRRFLQVAGLSGAAAGVASLTAGCSSKPAAPRGRPVRIGLVSSQTGALAGFGEADSVVVAGVRAALKDAIEINGTSYPLEIDVRDTGSQSQRAATVASDLINAGVDLLLASGTPEIVNFAADVAERAGTPMLSSVVPWQSYVFGRQKNPAKPKPFTWTYHFFWGLEDIIAVYSTIWHHLATNKVVAGVFPNDPDGHAWSNPTTGLPGALAPRGFSFVEPATPPEIGTSDYLSLIDLFKSRDAQILTGVLPPPDFATLWNEIGGGRRGFRPMVATVGKALLFPAFIEVLQPSPAGLTTEVWWHPSWPFKSSLTGQTCAEFAAEYTRQTHRQWTQPIGPVHALFEVAVNVLQRSGVGNPRAIVNAITRTNLDTIVGKIQWTGKPFPNVAKTPMVGGQWVAAGGQFPFDLQIVANPGYPQIPVTHQVQPLQLPA